MAIHRDSRELRAARNDETCALDCVPFTTAIMQPCLRPTADPSPPLPASLPLFLSLLLCPGPSAPPLRICNVIPRDVTTMRARELPPPPSPSLSLSLSLSLCVCVCVCVSRGTLVIKAAAARLGRPGRCGKVRTETGNNCPPGVERERKEGRGRGRRPPPAPIRHYKVITWRTRGHTRSPFSIGDFFCRGNRRSAEIWIPGAPLINYELRSRLKARALRRSRPRIERPPPTPPRRLLFYRPLLTLTINCLARSAFWPARDGGETERRSSLSAGITSLSLPLLER
jgi:hypothetical protein